MTLNLKKISKAEYGVSAGNVNIKVCNPYKSNGMGSNSWSLYIEVEGVEVENSYFDTKRQAVEAGTRWVLNN
jgi:hypothetical protein